MTDAAPRNGKRTVRAFDDIDTMPKEWRSMVHEYGYAITYACRKAGIKTPGAAHDLISEIWDGARSDRDAGRAEGTLDWLLSQSGSSMSASAFSRFLQSHNLMILPKFPTRAMVDASVAEVSNHGVICSKQEKHRLRLLAAMRAEEDYMDKLVRRKRKAAP